MTSQTTTEIWVADTGGGRAEKVLECGCVVMGVSPMDKYLLVLVPFGNDIGIHQISVADKRRTPLLLGVETFMMRFATDYQSFVYAVTGRGEVTFYRQGWRDGALVGKPQVALKVPFVFPFVYKGNAFDFSRDLSTIVYARPNQQADLYFLSGTQ